MALLGLDIGTTGCKAIIYSDAGELLGAEYLEYSIIAGDGTFEIDPNLVWQSVCAVLRGAVGKAGVRVDAIGISSFGESAVPIGRDGSVLANAILYTDPRGGEECKALERFTSITKVPAHPMYTVSKILWQKKHCPDLFAKVYKYLLFEDFIIYKLTGNCYISYSEATRTGCFDVENKCFSREVLSAVDLSEELFSKPVPPGTVCGNVKEFAELAGAVVTTGGQDQICSALGAGATAVGSAVCGIGTVECITPVFAKPIESLETLNKGYCCVPYAVDDTYVTYAYSYTGGAMLKWFRDEIADTGASGVYRTFDERVENSSTNLLLLPHFAGAATPYMDTGATGAILGLTLASTREDIYRAILEGCCFEMLLNIEQLAAAGIEISSIIATGGGAASRVWLQMKADIFGFPVRSLKNSEAGTVGAAILAGVAVGTFSSLQQGADRLIQYGAEYLPDAQRRNNYLKKYQKYKKIYAALREIR